MSDVFPQPLTDPSLITHQEHDHQATRPTIRQALKTHTQPYHTRMEAALAHVLHPMTVTAYRTLLARFYGVYAPLEAALASILIPPHAPLDFSRRRKTPLLVRDLQTLGCSSAAVVALPQCTSVPVLPDLAHALGCLYVLEGATLGGQVISRHVQQQFGFTSTHGSAFFNSYGAEVGSMWQTFCAILNATLLTEAQQEAAIATACATFATFERWIAEKRA